MEYLARGLDNSITLTGAILMLLLNPITIYGLILLYDNIKEKLSEDEKPKRPGMDRKTFKKLGCDHYLFDSDYFCPACGMWRFGITPRTAETQYMDIEVETETLHWTCTCGHKGFKRSPLDRKFWESTRLEVMKLANAESADKESFIHAHDDNDIVADIVNNYVDEYGVHAADVWFIDHYVRPLGQMDFNNVAVLHYLKHLGIVSPEEYFTKGGAEYDAQLKAKRDEEERKYIARQAQRSLLPKCPHCGRNDFVAKRILPSKGLLSAALDPWEVVSRRHMFVCNRCNKTFGLEPMSKPTGKWRL